MIIIRWLIGFPPAGGTQNDMGELVAGKPALRLSSLVSGPLDLVSVLSLLYRAVPGSGLDPWLIATRRALPELLRADLDLLHGFSGRLLYYMEEPVMRVAPPRGDSREMAVDDFLHSLEKLPAAEYRAMAAHALVRVHHDSGRAVPPLREAAEPAWRQALEPALTTADVDEVLALIAHPDDLKYRTLRLLIEVWNRVYRDEFAARLPQLHRAAALADRVLERGVSLAFADLTGNRPPESLLTRLGDVDRVTFCPSAHLGSLVSYVLYPPELIVFFGAPELIARRATSSAVPSSAGTLGPDDDGLSRAALLDALRALADPTRLRIVELLGEGELYAQEIVGRLDAAQSAVSRHLTQLERASLLTVRSGRGMKYYAVNRARLSAVTGTLHDLGEASRQPSLDLPA